MNRFRLFPGIATIDIVVELPPRIRNALDHFDLSTNNRPTSRIKAMLRALHEYLCAAQTPLVPLSKWPEFDDVLAWWCKILPL